MSNSELICNWTLQCYEDTAQIYTSSDKYYGIVVYQNEIIAKIYDTYSLDGEGSFEVSLLANGCFLKVNLPEKTITVGLRKKTQV